VGDSRCSALLGAFTFFELAPEALHVRGGCIPANSTEVAATCGPQAKRLGSRTKCAVRRWGQK
jgi:hypothetical protein